MVTESSRNGINMQYFQKSKLVLQLPVSYILLKVKYSLHCPLFEIMYKYVDCLDETFFECFGQTMEKL